MCYKYDISLRHLGNVPITLNNMIKWQTTILNTIQTLKPISIRVYNLYATCCMPYEYILYEHVPKGNLFFRMLKNNGH